MALRLAFMVGGGIALLAGLDAALLQLGVAAPVTSERIAAAHGILMVLGFIGTVIALERAVALGKPWGFAAPACMGLGGIALISPLPVDVAGGLLMAGTGIQAVIFIPLWRRRRWCRRSAPPVRSARPCSLPEAPPPPRSWVG